MTEDEAETRAETGEAVDLGVLDGYLGFHLRLAQAASFHTFATMVGATLDISPGRFALLALIGRNPGVGQTALSRANGLDKSTLTPALDDLERRGLIVRRRRPNDRRNYAIALSASGQAMLAKLLAYAEQHEAAMLRVVGAEDRALLIRLLRKLSSELSAE